jgi:chromosome segregation ATPase
MYLYGANDPQAVLSEVAKLRQKYEECRQEQNSLSPSDSAVKIQGYQKRLAVLENQIKQRDGELLQIKKLNTEMERDLSQKQGVIRSLEKSLTTKDRLYIQTMTQNESLAKEANTVKVGKIERESLKSALLKAKADLEKLEKSMGKNDKEVMALRVSLATAKAEIEKLRTHSPAQGQSTAKVAANVPVAVDQTPKIKALQSELAKANAVIIQLQKAPPQSVVREKVVTKVVEPTEKIAAFQRELSNAQATIANLKKGSSSKVVVQEKIVEKVVYKERPVIKEKIVEKVVYKDRPAAAEKVASKAVNPTEQLNKALHQKLVQHEVQPAKLKAPAIAKPTPPKETKLASAAVPAKVKSVSQATKTASEAPKKSAPSAYRMAKNGPIYSAPGGSVVDTWEERRSFTSGTASNGWVKITGYFVNRVWQRADRDLWVKESDVIKR